MRSITITLTLAELMALPGDAVTRIIDKAAPDKDFLTAAMEHENAPNQGKGRWPVNAHIRRLLATAH